MVHGEKTAYANAHIIFLSWVYRSLQDPRLTVWSKEQWMTSSWQIPTCLREPHVGAAGCRNHTASINQLLRMPSKDTLYYKGKALNFAAAAGGSDHGKQ